MRQDPESVPSEGQVLELVIQKLREALSEESGRKGKARGNGGRNTKSQGLQIPRDLLDKGTEAVKKEMKESLKVEIEDDELDWT